MTTETLLSIVYVSSASRPLDEADLSQILDAAKRHNQRDGITGLLLYKEGSFMQVVEGTEEVVMRLYDRIRRDARHHNVMLLLKETITERRFPDWSMSLKDVTRLSEQQRAELNPFLRDDFTAEQYRTNPGAAFRLLATFRDVTR